MSFVDRRLRDGSFRLFPQSARRASTDKLSAKFVRDFSNHKTALGIGPENTFHSSRHNISTMLRNTKNSDVRSIWMDAILGHAGGEDDTGMDRARSEGETTYMHGVDLKNLKLTVEAIQYPALDMGRVISDALKIKVTPARQ